MKTAVAAAQRKHSGVIWIEEMVDIKTKIELYSNAAVFVCPSIYEPFGIINLEAMACAYAGRGDSGRRYQGGRGPWRNRLSRLD